MNTPPKVAPHPGQMRMAWIAGVLILIVILAVLVVRHPRFRSWRATHLAGEAIVSLEKGEAEAAQAKVGAAYQLAPRNFTVLRAAARVTSAQRDPQAINFYQSLADSGTATGEDYVGFAESALNAGRFELFETNIRLAIEHLPPADVRVERLLGRYALVNGDFAAATTAFRLIAEADPHSATAKLDLAGALLATPELSAQRTAPPIVEEAIRMQPDLTTSGLRMLAAATGLPRDTRLDAISRLLALDTLTFDEQLDVRRMEISVDPSRGENVIDIVIQTAAGADSERRAAIARWLVHLGRNESALELLPLREAQGRMDWFLIWLDATAGLGRWNEVERALSPTDAALPPSVRELFLGRSLAAQGKPGSTTHYEKAITAASGDLDRLIYLAGYFNTIDQPGLAERTLNRIAEEPAAARTAFEALIGLHRRQQNTPALLAVLERMERRWNTDPVVMNDLLYVRLLTDRNFVQAAEAARIAATKNPGVLPFQITHALGLLRLGRPAEAMSLFEGSNLQLAQMLPQQRAVFAAILAANGDESSARDVARLIDRGALLPEEIALLPPPGNSGD